MKSKGPAGGSSNGGTLLPPSMTQLARPNSSNDVCPFKECILKYSLFWWFTTHCFIQGSTHRQLPLIAPGNATSDVRAIPSYGYWSRPLEPWCWWYVACTSWFETSLSRPISIAHFGYTKVCMRRTFSDALSIGHELIFLFFLLRLSLP